MSRTTGKDERLNIKGHRDKGIKVLGSRFKVLGLGFKVLGSRCWVQSLGCRV